MLLHTTQTVVTLRARCTDGTVPDEQQETDEHKQKCDEKKKNNNILCSKLLSSLELL